MITLTLEEDGKVLKRIEAKSVLFATTQDENKEEGTHACEGGIVGEMAVDDMAYLLLTTQHTATAEMLNVLKRNIQELHQDLSEEEIEQLAARTLVGLMQQVSQSDVARTVTSGESDR